MKMPRKRVDVKDYDRKRRGRPEHVKRHSRVQDVRERGSRPSMRALKRQRQARLTRGDRLAQQLAATPNENLVPLAYPPQMQGQMFTIYSKENAEALVDELSPLVGQWVVLGGGGWGSGYEFAKLDDIHVMPVREFWPGPDGKPIDAGKHNEYEHFGNTEGEWYVVDTTKPVTRYEVKAHLSAVPGYEVLTGRKKFSPQLGSWFVMGVKGRGGEAAQARLKTLPGWEVRN